MAGATAAYIRTLRGGRSAEAVRVGVSKGVSMCLSVFIAMALSRLMEPEAYGTYLQVLYVYGTLLVLFSLGLPACYSYFLARTDLKRGPGCGDEAYGDERCHGVCVLAHAVCAVGRYRRSAGQCRTGAVSASVFGGLRVAMMPVAGVEGVLVACRRSGQLAIYVCLSRLLTLLCVVGAARMCGGGPLAVTGAFAAASVASAVWGLWLSLCGLSRV